MPKFHHTSVFGPGPRRPLDREQRARFRFLVRSHRAAGHITAAHHDVADALLHRLGADGQCDPSQATLAADTGACDRTVRRALDQMKQLGLLSWHQRIVRAGWRVLQTSNAYLLMPTTLPNPASVISIRTIIQKRFPKGGIPRTDCPPVENTASLAGPPPSAAEQAAAQQALAARRAAVEARLAGRPA